MKDKILQLLNDPEAMWEAISVDGVSYPFDDSREGLSYEQKAALIHRVNKFDNERALAIGTWIKLHDEADTPSEKVAADAVIGTIMRRQIVAHLERIVEAE